ncbi:MAG: ABC transporter ATP-binding protein, partial [Gorillibacterium sp.]|nr:ABC transporter ATP-binding protein [Gorillibacterium sp.]
MTHSDKAGAASKVVAAAQNLRLKFPGEDTLVFQGLSFSVRQGEKVLLLGPSGSGKSTLLQVLSGIIPRAVEVPMKADELMLPLQPGLVFQDPDTQFCMPYVDEEIAFVLENLEVPREQMPALIKHYLEQVGLHLEQVHTPIQQLSQGMKQRLAIASILALMPDVLMLDEPTALLDEEGTKQVWDTIRTIASEKTVLIVEHKITGILDFIDRIVVFSPDGKIIADGQPEQIFRDYRRELMEYGIWYPGVWDDFAEWYKEHAGLPAFEREHQADQANVELSGVIQTGEANVEPPGAVQTDQANDDSPGAVQTDQANVEPPGAVQT